MQRWPRRAAGCVVSAYIVGKATIDCLVYARHYATRPGWGPIAPCETIKTDTEVGRMLSVENVRSVHARYEKSQDADMNEAKRYTAPSLPELAARFGRGVSTSPSMIVIVFMLKQVACYEYQACEHNGWAKSNAKRYCEMLRQYLIQALPGYDEAPWGVEP
jgi:hypothetical protein